DKSNFFILTPRIFFSLSSQDRPSSVIFSFLFWSPLCIFWDLMHKNLYFRSFFGPSYHSRVVAVLPDLHLISVFGVALITQAPLIRGKNGSGPVIICFFCLDGSTPLRQFHRRPVINPRVITFISDKLRGHVP